MIESVAELGQYIGHLFLGGVQTIGALRGPAALENRETLVAGIAEKLLPVIAAVQHPGQTRIAVCHIRLLAVPVRLDETCTTSHVLAEHGCERTGHERDALARYGRGHGDARR